MIEGGPFPFPLPLVLYSFRKLFTLFFLACKITRHSCLDKFIVDKSVVSTVSW